MIERQKRLKEVFEHLRKYFGVHTQIDFACALGYSRSVISAALNGREDYLTDKLFRNICEAYPGVFNLNYLITGEGELLADDNEETGTMATERVVNIPDHASLMNATIAAQMESIESLKRELATKDDLIQSLREHLAFKDRVIADLKARLNAEKTGISNYPFPVGVAEENIPKR